MKKIIALFSVLALLFSLSITVFAIDLPKPTNDFFVNDFANVISDEDEAEIMQIGADLYNQTTAQVVVVTVESLDGYEVNDYALELGREWGVGSEETNNGVVILLSVNDRQITIQVGYGLEGCLTDAGTGMILDDYAKPHLINDDFSTGLVECYKAVTNVVCEEYGIEADPNYIIDNYDYYDYYDDTSSSEYASDIVIAVIMVSIMAVAIIKKAKNGGDDNNGSNSGTGGHHHGGGMFYGGFSGGSSSRGGFSGGGGGFRGGGGSFGGGGSSRGF